MRIKFFIYIFIYIILTGCETQNVITGGCQVDTYLTMSAPSLEIDENGYYHMEYLNSYSQTFTTLNAETNSPYTKLGWISNKEIKLGGVWVNSVNQSAYTDDTGRGHTVLSAWEEFIGDTVKIYCGYHDECNTHYVDSLEVIIDNGVIEDGN